ncbi:stage II sporulation protein P [Paenibacillus sp.]|jgi:stage II sporulation protein P|uniref:stage II sporulation protein P n=1 Tax=Paenibacillus sp. TaxID=58172 RepID=UPI002836D785|nr:stage II sporulation protein P [Paenibacillus sp.]MDR0269014.1 stage II sporulation protein P [Paenibacillus sp.]
MKRNGFQLWNIAKWRAKMLHTLSMGRTFLLLTIGSFLFFVMLGLGGMAERQLNSSPVSSMKGFAASLSSKFFIDMLGMELPHLEKEKGGSTFSSEKMTTFMFQMLTSVNPRDPKSLIASEMPGMGKNDPVLLRSATGNQNLDPPEDFHLSPETDLKNGQTSSKDNPKEAGQTPTKEPEPGAKKEPGNQGTGSMTEPKGQNKAEMPPSNTSGKRVVMIYHSHSREAYNPLLGKTSDNPSSASPSKNVMVVGKYMADKLEKLGVGTIHSEQDYISTVNDFSYNLSYKYSRQTVKAALAQNNSLDYLIDIHRDSQKHAKTTTVINGASYAQVFFIIGHENKNWRKNEAFANAIHEQLEKSYPGISRGIWGKASAQGKNNGEYNQSLSEKSILIEVGGIDSTNEELKRTSEALAQIIADLYYTDQNAEKASADKTVSTPKAGSES